jgi:hypothetical protein
MGGPGVGKSTTATHVFSLLKMSGVNCEYVSEFAKDLTWSESAKTLGFQPYVFGEQAWRIERLIGKVDVIVTDSPLLLSSIYAAENLPQCFHDFVLWTHNRYDNINFYITRTKLYNPVGRNQTEEQAIDIDEKMIEFMTRTGIGFKSILTGDGTAPIKAFGQIMHILQNA